MYILSDAFLERRLKLIRTTKILNIVYCLIVLLFLLDSLTSFDIKSQTLKSLVYFSFLIGTPTILFWNLFSIKPKTKRVIATLYPTTFLILIFVMNPIKIFFSTGAWQTQTVLYKNRNISFKKVEFQMQGIGALGYNRRTVEVTFVTPLFMITSQVPQNIDKKEEWVRIEKDVNELGLKGQ